MSIFGSIMTSIFGSSAAKASAATDALGLVSQGTTAASTNSAAPAASAPSAPTAGAAATSQVDVAAVLDKIAETAEDNDLDWRKSIVDLMKILKLDSSLKARKELAKELHYSGDMGDSASMNIWLHKQVMTKLAANGGNVPDDLKG